MTSRAENALDNGPMSKQRRNQKQRYRYCYDFGDSQPIETHGPLG